MNFEQVIALVNAGYTKAEIDAMQGSQPEAQPVQPAADPEPVQAAELTQVETAPQQPVNADDPYTRLEDKLNQLIGLQQAQNVNANIGNAQPAKSTTDILGSVIAPPRRERTK